MKQFFKILFCAALVLCAAAWSAQAQRVTGAEDLTFRNGKLYTGAMALNGLNAADYLSAQQADRYLKARRAENAGAVLGCVGGVVAVASGISWAVSASQFHGSGSDIVPAGMTVGPMCLLGGTVVGVGGLILYLSGRNRVRLLGESVRAEGAVSQVELNAGVTPGGFGLALNF